MSLLALAGVGVLGGLGAAARFLVDGAVASRVATGFPAGTLVVNLSGALAVGVLLGATVSEDAFRLIATGLVGSYTTFSTWALESHRLAEDGELWRAGANFIVSLVLGVALAWLGTELGAEL